MTVAYTHTHLYNSSYIQVTSISPRLISEQAVDSQAIAVFIFFHCCDREPRSRRAESLQWKWFHLMCVTENEKKSFLNFLNIFFTINNLQWHQKLVGENSATSWPITVHLVNLWLIKNSGKPLKYLSNLLQWNVAVFMQLRWYTKSTKHWFDLLSLELWSLFHN